MTPSLRRVAGVTATVLGVLLVALFVVQAAPGLIGADASYVVLSGSMEPAISPGDAVVVDGADPASIEAGSIITFVRSEGDTPVTHRVVEVVEREDGLAFRTAGDANESPDPEPVQAENVIGEVWFVIPYVGHVVLFANTTTGFVVLVGLPVAAFVVSEFAATLGSGESTDEADHEFTFGERATGETAGDPSAAVQSASAESSDEDAVTVTATDLKLSSVGFVALTVYSGYVASLDPTPVRVAVFAAAAMVVALVALVLLSGSESASTAPREEGDPSGPFPDAGEADGGDGGDA